MDTILRDIRYAVRQLKRNPTFTLVAVFTLALGIGANTAMFSVVNGVLLRSLRFEDSDRLVRIFQLNSISGEKSSQVSYPTLDDLRRMSHSFAQVAGFRYWVPTISGGELAESYLGVFVTEEFPATLRVKLARGRWFQAGSDTPGRVSEVVLSDAAWASRYGRDPSVLGRTITVEGRPTTVVGILAPGFRFPDMVPDNVSIPSREPAIYLPAGLDPEGLDNRGNSSYWVVGRLAPGVTVASAHSDVSAVAAQLLTRFPEQYQDLTMSLAPLKAEIVGSAGRPLLVLLGAVGLVLLIACANVAGLLLARAAAREREFALRAALGAGPLGLVRQVLTESVILGLLGGCLGALLGSWGVDLIRALAANTIPRMGEVTVDGRILAFTTVVSVLSGILFGLSPAVAGTRGAASAALREGNRGSGPRSRLRSVLVVSEVALSVMLLSGAGLLLRSFASVLQADPGFDGRNVITLLTVLPGTRYPGDASQGRFVADAVGRMQRLPGVLSAAAVNTVPLSNLGGSTSFQVEGAPEDQAPPIIGYRAVEGAYFDALNIKPVAGRLFATGDTAGAPHVVLLSQAAVRKFFGDVDPIGRRMRWGNGRAPLTVVGVVQDVREVALDQPAPPLVYYPFSQRPEPVFVLLARTAGDPYLSLPAIRRELAGIDPDLAAFLVRTMPELAASTLQQRRFHLTLLGGFAAAALLMAGIGLYGLISYSVTQRTREIGIRVALGAGPGLVRSLLLREGGSLALTGGVLGLLGSLVTSRLLQSQLVGVRPLDPVAILGAVALLLVVTVAATLIPARRATRVDPMVALRQG